MWMVGGSKDKYLDAKRYAQHAVYTAKRNEEKKKFAADWSVRMIISLFKGKWDALDRNNSRGLKLNDHVLKVIERVAENIIRETVNIDEM